MAMRMVQALPPPRSVETPPLLPLAPDEEFMAVDSFRDAVAQVSTLGQAEVQPDVAEERKMRTILLEIESFNSLGIRELRQGRPDEALRLLTQAQAQLDLAEELPGAGATGGSGMMSGATPSTKRASRAAAIADGADAEALQRAHAATASNWGIYHRKRGELDLAIQCFQRALKYHSLAQAGLRILAAAHLHLSACHLELGATPRDSLQHAQAAVDSVGMLVKSAPEGQEPSADDCAMLGVAFNKLAEAHEALREWAQASHAYSQAYEVVRHSLGPGHAITRAFERSSRCPRHLALPPAPSPAPSAGAPVSRRLPSIPRAKTPISQAKRPHEYEIGPDVLAPWPPKNASKEEKRWYAMARKHGGGATKSPLSQSSPPQVPAEGRARLL